MPRKSNILLFPSKEYKLFLLSRNHTLAVQTLNVDIQLARSSYLWCHCVYAWCAQLYRIGICLSICISVGMPSIEWKWSEWIPLAELSALVAHTVGRSATETAQHCMATHRANQASRWHSLDITQERCTEQNKKKKKKLRVHGNSIHWPVWTAIQWTDTVRPFTHWCPIPRRFCCGV